MHTTPARTARHPYAPPLLVLHGGAVEATQGTCSCRAESSGFKAAISTLD